MSVLLICILIFVLFMVAGYAGLALQTRLVEEHKTGETKAVIGQISGLVSLLLALVLGTLIGVSWAYFSAQRTNLENFSAQILRLDQALGQFGPETKPMRDRLKEGIEKAYEAIWGGGTIDPALLTVEPALARAQAISDYLATLQPKTEAQKAALSTANTYASMVEQSRLLISLQIASGPVSWVRCGPHFRSAVHSLCGLSHSRTRHALYRPVQGFACRARTDDSLHQQVEAHRA